MLITGRSCTCLLMPNVRINEQHDVEMGMKNNSLVKQESLSVVSSNYARLNVEIWYALLSCYSEKSGR